MFNFSANHLIYVSKSEYDRCNVFVMKDKDTNRSYKIYDYKKKFEPLEDKFYCISGKVNSVEKLYLILENFKEQAN